MNVIEEFRAKMAQAKQVQLASGQNANLRDHVGEMMTVTGMHITEGIEIENLVIDKVTFTLADGTAIDGFHMAAVDKAEELIEVLGEGPYPIPLLMEVCEVKTKRGMKQYASLVDFAGSPSDVSFAELDEAINTPAEDPTPATPPEQTTPPITDQAPPAPTTRAGRAAAKAARDAAKGK